VHLIGVMNGVLWPIILKRFFKPGGAGGGRVEWISLAQDTDKWSGGL